MLETTALEALWERLAQAIDTAGPGHDRLMLAKLALLLADALGDPPRVDALLDQALQDLA